jgi:hypothetical protein
VKEACCSNHCSLFFVAVSNPARLLSGVYYLLLFTFSLILPLQGGVVVATHCPDVVRSWLIIFVGGKQMADLQKRFSIKTKNFKTITVEEKLGKGGQGRSTKLTTPVSKRRSSGTRGQSSRTSISFIRILKTT